MPKPNGRAKKASSADDRYMTAHQVAARFNISRRSVDNWVNAGKLPEPHKFTERTVLYVRAEIDSLRPARSAA